MRWYNIDLNFHFVDNVIYIYVLIVTVVTSMLRSYNNFVFFLWFGINVA